MPTVIRFNRCRIEMYFDDHPPPHFHVITRKEERIAVVIETLIIRAGNADPRDTAEAFEMGKRTARQVAGALETIFGDSATKGQEAMNETKAIRITSVKYAGDFKLRLRWVNRSVTLVDLTEPIHRVKGLQPLLDAEIFAKASKGEGGHSVTWPVEVDMGADRLWELALEQTGHHDTVEFLRWRWRYGLSLTAAADALGLSRRQVAYYASGKHRVPRTVLLACKGWEAERKAA